MNRWNLCPKDEYTFQGVECIKLKFPSTPPEYEINSENGFIWPNGAEGYKACITNNKIINKHYPDSTGYKYKPGEEKIINFPASQLETVMNHLKYRGGTEMMKLRANNFR